MKRGIFGSEGRKKEKRGQPFSFFAGKTIQLYSWGHEMVAVDL